MPVTSTPIRIRTGRKRRVAGWFLLVIGVLITGVWGASRWWYFGCAHNLRDFRVGRGVVTISAGATARVAWWHADRVPNPELGWNWTIGPGEMDFDMPGLLHAGSTNLLFVGHGRWQTQSGQTYQIWTVYPWPFALTSLLGGGWLVWSGRRARRRAMVGLCLKCGYDLAGLAAGASCP
ncbi:MAG: hypothetical protein ACREJO_08125, partial [Phycisphaerales bacterium]